MSDYGGRYSRYEGHYSTPSLGRPQSVNAEDAHREVQMNAISGLNQARQSTPILVVSYLIWNILEVAAIAIVLGISWEQPCDTPLRAWLFGKLARNLIIIPIHIRRLKFIPETEAEVNIQSLLRISTFVLFILAQGWLTESSTCSATAPALYYLGISLLVVVYLTVLAPLLLVMLICLCLPCVLMLFRHLQIGDYPVGASTDQLEDIPTFKYDPQQYSTAPGQGDIEEPQAVGSPSQKADIPVAPSSDTTQPSAPPLYNLDENNQPTCAICLCEYEPNDELRRLPCRHDFHKSCIDNWLPINNTCPTCRNPINASPDEHRQQQQRPPSFFQRIFQPGQDDPNRSVGLY